MKIWYIMKKRTPTHAQMGRNCSSAIPKRNGAKRDMSGKPRYTVARNAMDVHIKKNVLKGTAARSR